MDGVIAAAIAILAISSPPVLLVDPVEPLKTERAKKTTPATMPRKNGTQEVLQNCCIMEIPVQVRS